MKAEYVRVIRIILLMFHFAKLWQVEHIIWNKYNNKFQRINCPLTTIIGTGVDN